MQRVRVLLVGLLRRLLQPLHRAGDVAGLLEQAAEIDHAEFEHGGAIAEAGGMRVPLHCFGVVALSAAAVIGADFAAYRGTVRCNGVAAFRGGLVEGEGLAGVVGNAEKAVAHGVGVVEHGVAVALAAKGFHDALRFLEVLRAIALLVGPIGERVSCTNESFGEFKLRVLVTGLFLGIVAFR